MCIFFLFLAPQVGLEPTTSWLTVTRSTDWATEEYLLFHFLQSLCSVLFRYLESFMFRYIMQATSWLTVMRSTDWAKEEY